MPRSLCEEAGGCCLKVCALLHGQIHMLFDVVHLVRFVRFGRILYKFVEMVDQHAEGIAENGADLDEHINAWASELFKRDEAVVADFACAS